MKDGCASLGISDGAFEDNSGSFRATTQY